MLAELGGVVPEDASPLPQLDGVSKHLHLNQKDVNTALGNKDLLASVKLRSGLKPARVPSRDRMRSGRCFQVFEADGRSFESARFSCTGCGEFMLS
jgi:hypothetical protein